jgi:hypothetical protein
MTKRRMLVGLLGANIQGSITPALFAEAFAAAWVGGDESRGPMVKAKARAVMRKQLASVDCLSQSGVAAVNAFTP